MPSRAARLLPILLAGSLATLSACKGGETAAPADPAASESVVPTETEAQPSADASDGTEAGIAAGLDMGALQERRDPERLLRFYTNAVRVGDWGSAAKAWSLDALMTPEKLEAEFGGAAGPKIAVGRGDAGTAAGSLYYEAPVTIDFQDGRDSRRGTIVLRRANDVPGASELQLVWRIERSSIVQQ
ncbi:hypothetical protein [Novosphingobium sp. 9U]|uniref:hypothetical protein n=1 Tax=Novosphingobium sp. 9U TaxID=2653158 RepID=UPI00135974F8|nr:hypothetical protein [Novosphingobium sp. 9U]